MHLLRTTVVATLIAATQLGCGAQETGVNSTGGEPSPKAAAPSDAEAPHRHEAPKKALPEDTARDATARGEHTGDRPPPGARGLAAPADIGRARIRTRTRRDKPSLIFGFSSGASNDTPEERRTKRAASERAVRRKIPIGTAANDAERIMTAMGFSCRLKTDSDYGERRHIDYLYCVKDEPVEFLVGNHRTALLVIKDGKIAEISYAEGLVGP